jgi:hypothetical protein
MNKILFLALAIAITAVAGLSGLTAIQDVNAHCDGIGNCNGFQDSGSGASGNDGDVDAGGDSS